MNNRHFVFKRMNERRRAHTLSIDTHTQTHTRTTCDARMIGRQVSEGFLAKRLIRCVDGRRRRREKHCTTYEPHDRFICTCIIQVSSAPLPPAAAKNKHPHRPTVATNLEYEPS